MSPIAPRVLYEDAHLVALDKPPGQLVIPGRVMLAKASPEAGGASAVGPLSLTVQEEAQRIFGRLWVVHRLDRGTSGVLLLARSAAAHRALNLAFERRQVAKRYLALVRGTPPPDARLDAPIVPGRKGRMRIGVAGDPRAKEAATRVRRLETFAGQGTLPAAALVEATPETGRTHQIRVHLAWAGTPLLYDLDYGPREGGGPLLAGGGAVLLDRTPLHAARLELLHPVTGVALTLEAPLPADLANVLQAYRCRQAFP